MRMETDEKLRRLLLQADEDFTLVKDSYQDNSKYLISTCKSLIITEFPGTRYLASDAPEDSAAAAEFWTLCCSDRQFELAIALRHQVQEAGSIYPYWLYGYSSVVTHSRMARQEELTPLARASPIFKQAFTATVVSLVSGHSKREVLHIYYQHWRDGDVPEHGPLVLELLYSFVQAVKGRVITHCQAGRGRTGSAIAYFMLRDLPTARARDVVRWLRSIRAHMVSTYEQYRFVRYAFKKFLNASQEESPEELQAAMAAIDQRPVNIIVVLQAVISQPNGSQERKEYKLSLSSKPWIRRRAFLKRAIREAESRFGLRVDVSRSHPLRVGIQGEKAVLIQLHATKVNSV